jgi:hypothetical protein
MENDANDGGRLSSPEIELTPEMIRAGVAVCRRWNYEEEEVECLVVAIFLAMREALGVSRNLLANDLLKLEDIRRDSNHSRRVQEFD